MNRNILQRRYYIVVSYREFGGVTEDSAGFFVQICEVAIPLAALIAYKRALNDYRALYDFRPEMEQEMKKQVTQVEQSILANPLSNKKEVQEILEQLFSIPASEAMYVDHFEKLYDAVTKYEIKVEPVAISNKIGSFTNGSGTITPLFDTLQLVSVSPEEIEQFLQAL